MLMFGSYRLPQVLRALESESGGGYTQESKVQLISCYLGTTSGIIEVFEVGRALRLI